MARHVRLRPRAIADLGDIWAYTAGQWGEAQAADYLESLDATLNLLAEFPEMARLRQEITPPVRIHAHRAHLIIYIPGPEALDILRIVHARANWAEFLAE